MSLFSWILLGLVAGFAAGTLFNRTERGMAIDLLLGVSGAIVGGWLFRILRHPTASGVGLEGTVGAIVGAAVVLAAYRVLFFRDRGGRASESPVLRGLAHGALEAFRPRPWYEHLSASGEADAPAANPDIELPLAHEGQQLDMWENEGGAPARVSSTRRSSWRSSWHAFTSYPSLGAAST